MAALKNILPWLGFGLGGGLVAKALQTPKGPAIPDFSSLLAQAPTAKTAAVGEEALARRRNRRASAAPRLPATLLTGPGGLGSAPTTTKSLLGS